MGLKFAQSFEFRSTKNTSVLGGSDSFVKTLGMEYNSNQDNFRFSSIELSIEESLINHNLWWNSPSWLKDPSNWHSKVSAPPSLETLYSSGIDEASLQLKERKDVTLQATTVPNKAKPVIDIERYSNYMHLVRVTTWVFRVVTLSHLFTSTPLSVTELSKAKT